MEQIYFAGGYYFPVEVQTYKHGHNLQETRKISRCDKPKEFGLVHNTGDPRPYLTKNRKGLKTTEGHANLYALSEDGKVAVLIDFRCAAAGCGKYIALTEEQQKLIQKSIETDYYFD